MHACTYDYMHCTYISYMWLISVIFSNVLRYYCFSFLSKSWRDYLILNFYWQISNKSRELTTVYGVMIEKERRRDRRAQISVYAFNNEIYSHRAKIQQQISICYFVCNPIQFPLFVKWIKFYEREEREEERRRQQQQHRVYVWKRKRKRESGILFSRRKKNGKKKNWKKNKETKALPIKTEVTFPYFWFVVEFSFSPFFAQLLLLLFF